LKTSNYNNKASLTNEDYNNKSTLTSNYNKQINFNNSRLQHLKPFKLQQQLKLASENFNNKSTKQYQEIASSINKL